MEVVNVSAIVNAVFACELYLKLLIKSETRGHNLEILFDRLEPGDKDSIKISITEKLKSDSLEKGFDYYLKGISDDFAYWRYIYEKPDFGELGLNIGLRAINCFIEGLKESIDFLPL